MGTEEGNWGPGIIGLAATCEALVLIFTVLRIYTRVWIARAFWWDDFTIIMAVLGTTIGCSLCFVEVHYGFGKHIQFLDEHELRQFRKYTFGEWIQTFATLMWTKISICLFLIRIPNSKKLKTVMYWAVGFLLFSNTILTVMWIMACQPVHTQWYGEGICMSKYEKEAIIMTQAIISIVSDFVLAAFPIFYFWRLQVDLKTKIGLWLLMCLGVITGACCIVRTVLNGDSIPVDETYDGIVNWTWRLFEVQFGIIAACVPTLRPLYTLIVAKIHGEPAPMGDGNIKFLHSEKEQGHRWLEDKHHKQNGHAPNGDLERGHNEKRKHTINIPGMHPKHAEDLRQDLMNEGIIKSNAHTGTEGRDRSDIEHNASFAGLGADMHKYGIPDEFSSPEQTPKHRQEEFEEVVGEKMRFKPAPAPGKEGPQRGRGNTKNSTSRRNKAQDVLGDEDDDGTSNNSNKKSPSPPQNEGARRKSQALAGLADADLGRSRTKTQRAFSITEEGFETAGMDEDEIDGIGQGNDGLDDDDALPGAGNTRPSVSGLGMVAEPLGFGGVGLGGPQEDDGDSSRSRERREGLGLQEVLDSDQSSEEGVGPMQAAREWEPGVA